MGKQIEEVSSIDQHIFKSRNSSKYLLRLIPISIGLLVIGFFLGIAFILIFHGIIFGSIYLAMYWKPAFFFVTKLIGVYHGEITYRPRKLEVMSAFAALINFGVFGIVPIVGGIWLLVTSGFCGQNILYLLIKSLTD